MSSSEGAPNENPERGSFAWLGNRLVGLSAGATVMASAIVTWLTVILIGGVFLGAPIVGGIFGGAEGAVAWTAVIALTVYVGFNADQFSIPFALSFVAVLLLLSQILPGWLTRPFAVIGETLGIGATLAAVDPVSFAVLVTATIIGFWALNARLHGRGKKPSTVTKRVRVQAERLVREYATMTRVVFAFSFAVVFIFASEGGNLLGELTRMAAGAPVVVGYLASVVGFWGSYVRGLPFIGSVDPLLFLALMAGVFLVAVGVKYQ